MRSVRAAGRSWPVRVAAAAVFALAAAALAQAGAPGPNPTDGSTRFKPAHVPSAIGELDLSDLRRMVTPEGTQIFVSAGPFTAQQIYIKLKANGLDAVRPSMLTVRVQDAYPPTRVTWNGNVDRSRRRVTLWLDAWPDSAFSATPDRVIAHELGRVLGAYLFSVRTDDRSSYLDARGLTGDRRLGTDRVWMPEEILADDYRLLFGSVDAIAQGQAHINDRIADPREVPGLRDFFLRAFAAIR